MLIPKNVLTELRERFHLNIYEVKIWTSLLSRGVAAASELADISGVPRSRCYDVLESLEKKGFIIMKIGKPIKYIAVQPEVVVDRVKKRFEDEAKEQIQLVENLEGTDLFGELELLHKTGVKKVDVDNITDSIVGRSNINRFLKQMLMRAENSVLIATTDAGVKYKMAVLKKVKRVLNKNNIKVNFYTNTRNIPPHQLDNIEFHDNYHEGRMVNVDNKEVLFILEGESPEFDSSVWIKSPYFAEGLQNLFEKSLR